MIDYEKLESNILNESPYNPYKHFLFNVPEILATLLKFAFIIGLVYVVISASLETSIKFIPEICKIMNTEGYVYDGEI